MNTDRLQYNLGLCLLDTGDPGGTIAHFQRVLASQPNWTDARFSLAMAFVGNGEKRPRVGGRQGPAPARLHPFQDAPSVR